LASFEEYHKEDSSSKIWAVGIELIYEWLRLMDMAQAEKSEVAALIKRVFDNQHTGQIWFDTARGICYWCKENGHPDFIPDDYHFLLK
jgi:hypothetical protein